MTIYSQEILENKNILNKQYLTVFKEWINEFKIKIKSELYFNKIFEKWISNNNFIYNTNIKNLSYALGHNHFSGMDKFEFKKYIITNNK